MNAAYAADLLGWPAMALLIVFYWIAARGNMKLAYPFALLSSFMWTMIGVMLNQWSLASMNLTIFFISLYGFAKVIKKVTPPDPIFFHRSPYEHE